MIVAATAGGVVDIATGHTVLADRDVSFFTSRNGESWALVEHGATLLRGHDGVWREVAHFEDAAAIVAQPIGGERVLVGTAGAHVLRVGDDVVKRLDAFDVVPGRGTWTNPAAGGRPDVWSFASDGTRVFASVHVGGLWRSENDGESWDNVLAPEVDVHQVCATDDVVVVAAEGGFGVSRDGGDSWTWITEGLHAHYLQCAALAGGAVFVGASSGPFGEDAAMYRASSPGARFERRSAGLPDGFEPVGPYHLAADGDHVAVAPWNGTVVFASDDAGVTWSVLAQTFPTIRSLTAV